MATLSEKLARARAIIDSNPYDIAFNPGDTNALSRLSDTHLIAVYRRKNRAYPTDKRHLHVIAYDWIEPQQWSWNAAIKIAHSRDPVEARKTRLMQRQLGALRQAIAPDMADFRAAATPKRCTRCQSEQDLTTDHYAPPFIAIANDYLREFSPALAEGEGRGAVFAQQDEEAHWIQFHAQRAVYQLLCRSCNASKGAR